MSSEIRTGRGVPQDYAEAARWYRRAADQGEPIAQFNLGNMHVIGEGVPQDYVLAHMWLNRSASRATGGAQRNAVGARDKAAGLMNPI